jgi:hypothetical protein
MNPDVGYDSYKRERMSPNVGHDAYKRGSA